MTKIEEFRRGLVQLIASTVGLGVGVIGLASYNLGLFARDLNASIGLSKAQYGAGYAAFTFGLALGLGTWGRLLSRFGAAKTTAISAVGMAACFAGLAGLTTSPAIYIGLLGCLGLCGGATSGITFTRVISDWFDKGRGFALGLTQIGLGASGALIPMMTASVIRAHGWRGGYLALSLIALIGVPIALFCLRMRSQAPSRSNATPALDSISREDFRVARKGRVFWTLLVAFSATTLFVSGSAQHMVPMLREFGVDSVSVAKYVSMVGIGTICVRVIFGWLSDLLHAPWLMATSCVVGAFGLLMVGAGGAQYAALYAFTLGWAFGGEIDLIAYMTTRYFKMSIFPRVYAWQYGALSICAGISPFSIGWMADVFHSYKPGLYVCTTLALVAAMLFLTLPRYRDDALAGRQQRKAAKVSSSPSIGSQSQQS
ncbi:MFS transporter [Caballeronia sp. LP003]|uniref:MFS transporter n=1 Tax=Caballeronia sp. LP003 TaxID=3038551 RepID=UPI0028625DA6|nr:MFS transporter [Caballeronia sp. LP003]MDR5785320.1 MFS transporter [Caballeronia sp. LP003]